MHVVPIIKEQNCGTVCQEKLKIQNQYFGIKMKIGKLYREFVKNFYV